MITYRLLRIQNLYCVYPNVDALCLESALRCVQFSSIDFVVAG